MPDMSSAKISNNNCLLSNLVSKMEMGKDAKPTEAKPAEGKTQDQKPTLESIASSLFSGTLKKTEAGLAKLKEAQEAGWAKKPTAKGEEQAPPAATKPKSIVEQVLEAKP